VLPRVRPWFLLALDVLAAIGASFGALVYFGRAWVVPLEPVTFFAIMVGGILLGGLLSIYYVLLASRSNGSPGRLAWLLAFACAAPVATFAAWYFLVLRDPTRAPRVGEGR
jgi:drug/metabolite transporter (DMT)-like permease